MCPSTVETFSSFFTTTLIQTVDGETSHSMNISAKNFNLLHFYFTIFLSLLLTLWSELHGLQRRHKLRNFEEQDKLTCSIGPSSFFKNSSMPPTKFRQKLQSIAGFSITRYEKATQRTAQRTTRVFI